ncbi:MAG: gamma-glutamyl-gamma-aminobutyrate hydrolase family protein [Candidatus Micrarchaeia archaeon]|jgi:GMP synthase-like glutamine amidotransferase
MRIGILNTAESKSPEMRARFGRYANLFREKILGDEFKSIQFDVLSNELPSFANECDGYLITGSDAAVYDQLSWINPLKAFVRTAADAQVPLVGICFGHQLIADALGGRVVKSSKGFGIGLHVYDVANVQPWMDKVSTVSMLVFHEDQVVTPPQQTKVILSSSFTPFAGLTYIQAPIISFQAHPEFSSEYIDALLGLPDTPKLPQELLDKALTSINKPNDNARVVSWIRRFLKRSIPSKG